MFSVLRKFITPPGKAGSGFSLRRKKAFESLLCSEFAPAAAGRGAGSDAKAPRGGDSVLPFDTGELPNVIQFLTMSARTGQLYVEFPHAQTQGNMFLRDGLVYAVYYGPELGLDALASMCNTGCGRAHFQDGQQVSESNVDLPTTSLLVEAVVRADERISEGIDTPPPKDVSVQDLEPLDNAESRKSTDSFMTGLMLMAKVGAVIGVFAAAFITNYFGYETLQDIKERRLAEEQRTAAEQHEARIQAMRSKAVKRWYNKAETAYQKKEYAEAANLLEITLRLDAGFRPAQRLAGRIDESRDRLMLIPQQSKAEVALERAKRLDKGEGIGEKIEALSVKMKSAKSLAEAAEYTRAGNLFREVIADVEKLEAADRLRAEARTLHARVKTPRTTAQKEQAATYAAVQWEKARRAEAAGAVDFAKGNFQQAIEHWSAAAETYGSAATAARGQRAVQTVRAEFAKLMNNEENVAIMEQYASDAWHAVQSHADKAKKLEVQGRSKEAENQWELATATLSGSLKNATARRDKERYEAHMAVAGKELDNGNWQLAATSFEKALKLAPGKADEAARQGLHEAHLHAALAEANDAMTDGEWTIAQQKAEYALKLDPDNPEGRKLLENIADRLVPRLTVQALINDKPVYNAVVALEAKEQTYLTPVTFKLEKGRFYALTVTAPPQGYVYYEPREITYHANEPGPKTLAVRLEKWGAPKPENACSLPGLNLQMAPIQAGTFIMGASSGRLDERPAHKVTLTEPFWMAKQEVTNGDYRAFLDDSGYQGKTDAASGYLKHFGDESDIPDSDRHPVCYVSWKNAQAFCQWLTRREQRGGRLPEGYEYRLPTEAEWEYACRAGTLEDFAGEVSDMAHYALNSDGPNAVGTRLPNAWGLYDMHGNMWEMCYDAYGEYTAEAQQDPVREVRGGGQFRVVRGGSWSSVRQLLRSAYRSSVAPADIRRNLGFRVVLAPEL